MLENSVAQLWSWLHHSFGKISKALHFGSVWIKQNVDDNKGKRAIHGGVFLYRDAVLKLCYTVFDWPCKRSPSRGISIKPTEMLFGEKENDQMPLISVVVPIYNVEDYLHRCLDSLCEQTFNDVEFVLIDDGATDKSGNIADQYKCKDSRFRILHTKNHGLSAARNYGVDISRGRYIMFVDSDDYVARDFCEKPYKAAIANNADIVVFGYTEERRNGKKVRKPEKNLPNGIIDEMAVYEYGDVATWNKLYKKELFREIRYPEGRVSEDTATTHKLIHSAKRIYFLQDNLYYYNLCRGNSITHTASAKNKIDAFIAAKERHEALVSYGYSENKLLPLLYSRAIGVLTCMSSNKLPVFAQADEIVKSIKGIPNYLSWKQKIALVAWKADKRFFSFLCKLTGRL